jgi:hypothetical protein
MPSPLERDVVQIPFTPPFSATAQLGAPLYVGTTYNLLANYVAQIRNAHPAPGLYGGDGIIGARCLCERDIRDLDGGIFVIWDRGHATVRRQERNIG